MDIATVGTDWPWYDTLAAAVDSADEIVIGSTIGSRYEAYTPKLVRGLDVSEDLSDAEIRDLEQMATLPYTVTSVLVEQSLKGDISTNTVIDFAQVGGVLGRTRYIGEGVTYLSDTQGRVLLFLKRGYGEKTWLWPINELVGAWQVDGDEFLPIAAPSGYVPFAIPSEAALVEAVNASIQREQLVEG